MRNPNRLDPFYDELKRIHKRHYPDMRFGQLMTNFFYWIGKDPFFIEEPEMLDLLHDFAAGRESPYSKKEN